MLNQTTPSQNISSQSTRFPIKIFFIFLIAVLLVVEVSRIQKSKSLTKLSGNKQENISETQFITSQEAIPYVDAVPTPRPFESTGDKPVINGNYFQFNNNKIFFAKNRDTKYPDQYIAVYLSDGKKTVKLADEIPLITEYGSIPKFRSTSDPNLVIFATVMPNPKDFLNRFQTVGFVLINSKKMFTVRTERSYPGINIVDFGNRKTTINYSTSSTCKNQDDLQSNNVISLNGISMNNTVNKIFNPSMTLSCIENNDTGYTLNPNPSIKFTGIDKNFDKVYLKVSFNSTMGVAKTYPDLDFAFNIIDNSVVATEPGKMLK